MEEHLELVEVMMVKVRMYLFSSQPCMETPQGTYVFSSQPCMETPQGTYVFTPPDVSCFSALSVSVD